MDAKKAVKRHLMRGSCCSEALIRFGLELLQEDEDERLTSAASALCNGMFSGAVCGGLTGGCLLLGMVDRSAAPELCQEFCEWFDVTVASRYASVYCRDILGEDPWNKIERCQPMIMEIADKCQELLVEHGLIEEVEG